MMDWILGKNKHHSPPEVYEEVTDANKTTTLRTMAVGKNMGNMLMDLQAMSVHDANRARRLLNCGCPKAIVIDLCQIADPAVRDATIKNEEVKRFLEALQAGR